MRAAFLKVSAIGVVASTLLGCGESSSSPTTPSPSAFTISILGDRSFSPNPAPAGGQTVVFRNTDNVAHRVRLNDESVDWGTIPPGATSQAMQMPSGGANYHCSLHPGMIGSVSAASGAGPPPCNDPGYC